MELPEKPKGLRALTSALCLLLSERLHGKPQEEMAEEWFLTHNKPEAEFYSLVSDENGAKFTIFRLTVVFLEEAIRRKRFTLVPLYVSSEPL